MKEKPTQRPLAMAASVFPRTLSTESISIHRRAARDISVVLKQRFSQMPLYDLYYKLFEQNRPPVCTAISLVTTIAIEALICIAADAVSHASFGAVGVALSTGLFVVLGTGINLVAGFAAHRRREY
jgi:hypothetical protein